jgi:restriction system protein
LAASAKTSSSDRATIFDSVDAGTASKPVQSLSWQQFEQLTGEAFRRRGFQVTENSTGGADGGIDLVLQKNGEKYLVQCKQWRALKVGVSVVRELYGVMAAGGAAGGFVVTSGRFTKEASDFALGRNVELVDGVELQRWIQAAGTANRADSVSASVAPQEAAGQQQERVVCCPKCQATMVRRTAKRGPNAGSSFWGCSKYPACRGTL